MYFLTPDVLQLIAAVLASSFFSYMILHIWRILVGNPWT